MILLTDSRPAGFMPENEKTKHPADSAVESNEQAENPGESRQLEPDRPREIGGREGLDPTRYGDWEKNGRCIDF